MNRHPVDRLQLILKAAWRRSGPLRRAAVVTTPFIVLTLLAVGCFTFSDQRDEKIVDRVERKPPDVSIHRMVRVRLVGPRRAGTLRLEINSPFELRAGPGGSVIQAEVPRLDACAVAPGADGGIMLGDQHYAENDLFITPKRDASIIVNGSNSYRGLLRIARMSDEIAITNHIDIESYLKGVLRGELPRHFHVESFKAQCVAARTYVLYQMKSAPADRSFDVYDNEGSQMYIGVTGEGPTALAAVEATGGEVCIWPNGSVDTLFCTYYSSTCGGKSQHVNNFKPNDPDVAPLHGGVVCNDCYLSNHYEWEPLRVTKADLTQRIVKRYPSVASIGEITSLRLKVVEPGGRVVRIQMNGVKGANETLVGEDFRLCVGGHKLKSTHFTLSDEGDAFVFSGGRGFGHGVGLCQYGMETKARRGQDYKKILKTYYPGAEIRKLY